MLKFKKTVVKSRILRAIKELRPDMEEQQRDKIYHKFSKMFSLIFRRKFDLAEKNYKPQKQESQEKYFLIKAFGVPFAK